MMSEWVYLFKREPKITVSGDKVTIEDLRDHKHRARKEHYVKKEFSLKTLDSAWYAVEPLPVKRFAHTFYVFDFKTDSVVVSVEAKRKVGQSRPVVWGFLPLFPITYTFTTERDTFELRSDFRGKDVFVYKLKLTRQETRKLFLEVVRRAKEIQDKRLKFNSIYRNCTTESLRCLEKAVPEKFKRTHAFKGDIDKYLLRSKILDTQASNLKHLRSKNNISHHIRAGQVKHARRLILEKIKD